MASTTFLLAMTAPRGAYPLESPLAVTRMSGCTFQMIDGEVAARTAHASHDFVGDEQHSVAATDVCDGFEISRRWDDGAERRSTDRFEDEGCSFAVGCLDRLFEFGGILLAAVAASVGAIEVAAVAVRHSDVRELAHHGEIHFAASLVAGYRECAERGAVIALLAAEDLVAGGLSDFDLILACQLQRGLNRFRSAAGEVDSAAAKMFSGKSEQFFGIFFGERSGELAGVDEFEFRGLLGHRGGDFRDAMSDEVDGGGAGEIEILVALSVPHVDPLAANGGGEVFAEGTPEDRGARLDGRGIGHGLIIALRPLSFAAAFGFCIVTLFPIRHI